MQQLLRKTRSPTMPRTPRKNAPDGASAKGTPFFSCDRKMGADEDDHTDDPAVKESIGRYPFSNSATLPCQVMVRLKN